MVSGAIYLLARLSQKKALQVYTKVLHLSKVNYEVDSTAETGCDATTTITENEIRSKLALWLSYLGISYIAYKEEAGNDKTER